LADAVRAAYAYGGDVGKVIHDSPHGPDVVQLDPEPLAFQRGELPAKMEQAAFALKEGEWIELNDAPGTFVFIQLVKRSRRDLNEVSTQIEKKLQALKLKEELEELKKKSGTWMDEAYFGPSTPVPARASAPGKSGMREEKNEDKPQR